jgi:CheY-like chemotaxis protein
MPGRILVLDDEENYAEMLQELLRENNYRVDMATRPERAIDQLEEIPYDLVISDYKMPVMDGADFLKRTRELYPNLPFILVSGLMNTPELVKVANMSVTLVMEKPLDTAAFLQHVARFSVPMTDEEKDALAKHPDATEGLVSFGASSYPDEPRFFSAGSAASKRFMRDTWGICRDGSHLFILEPNRGEGELAVKDISVWRGNEDKPVESIALTELIEGGSDKLQSIFDNSESSQVVSVRVAAPEELSAAVKFAESSLAGFDGLLLVFILSAEGSETVFNAEVGDLGLILPALSLRPSDVATYARRYARLTSERLSKPNAAAFSAEAIFAVLAYEWASYKQIQEIITKVVSEGEDVPISGESLYEQLGLSPESIPAPDRRLAALLKQAQDNYLRDLLASTGDSAADLARKLELESSIQTKDDLQNMPLIKADLAKL